MNEIEDETNLLETQEHSFAKILQYFEKEYLPNKIVIIEENSITNKNMFYKNGFEKIEELKPGYKYALNNKRVTTVDNDTTSPESRKRDSKGRFIEDSPAETKTDLDKNLIMIWEYGEVETQKTNKTKANKIWDCGYTKFVKILNEET